MAKSKTNALKFFEHSMKVLRLFQKANRKDLDKALNSKDLAAAAKAFGMTEKELKSLLDKGTKLAKKLA